MCETQIPRKVHLLCPRNVEEGMQKSHQGQGPEAFCTPDGCRRQARKGLQHLVVISSTELAGASEQWPAHCHLQPRQLPPAASEGACHETRAAIPLGCREACDRDAT